MKNNHTVKNGDTLAYIAYKYETTVSEIVRLNPELNKRELYFGQTLKIK